MGKSDQHILSQVVRQWWLPDILPSGEWRYVDTKQNPADDTTIAFKELTKTHRWYRGPVFLYLSPSQWPVCPPPPKEITTELRKPLFCGYTQSTKPFDFPDPKQYNTCANLIDATCRTMQNSPCHSHSDSPSLLRKKQKLHKSPMPYLRVSQKISGFPDFRCWNLVKQFHHIGVYCLSPLNLIKIWKL